MKTHHSMNQMQLLFICYVRRWMWYLNAEFHYFMWMKFDKLNQLILEHTADPNVHKTKTAAPFHTHEKACGWFNS